MNLNKVPKVKVNSIKRKLYIYYLMRYLTEYNLIDGFRDQLIKLGANYSSSKIYDVFLKQFSKKKNDEILKVYTNFIDSKKFRIYADNLTEKSKLIRYY